jgi:hypothetical protein
MPKGPQGQKRPADVIGNAVKVMRIATGEIEEEVDSPSGSRRVGKARRESACRSDDTGTPARDRKESCGETLEQRVTPSPQCRNSPC